MPSSDAPRTVALPMIAPENPPSSSVPNGPTEREASNASSPEASSSEPAPATPVEGPSPFWTRNRLRIARFLVMGGVFWAVVDLVTSAPRDAELVLPLEPLLAEAREGGTSTPDEARVSVLDGEGALMTHARVRLPEGLENLHHDVRVPAGSYTVVVEVNGASAVEGTFDVPADGAIRVHLRPRP